ncbi:beta-ketoacyl synthase N-terminal-like domain-containing protein [Flammeovirga sp. SJP92]|uniref:beta-ketoacyl synthase N-terminal-like domain-containing protein n=1 Tax=Flammeovirga sp. SJP92 TaxID=1775430 RepID=UPI000788AC30|nr:beta-ketoacyl synthase N-terminal-like domain-containing protein [Flammeovirga sp. SJP92]KXX71694.1 hypothetical protein AVL50_05320 [Flammeovirga sp. SJP92]
MQKKVYVVADALISSLGNTPEENFEALSQGKSGVELHNVHAGQENYLSLIDMGRVAKEHTVLESLEEYTRLEQLFIASIQDVLQTANISLSDKKTLLLLSTTKGNIDLLNQDKQEQFGKERLFIGGLAQKVGDYFECANTVQTISTACISGVAAQNIAARLLQGETYEHIVVCGGDIIDNFTLSGFTAFNAVAPQPCQPFDKDREGVSLGEAIGTVVLSTTIQSDMQVLEGAMNNDANHISAPSRTGEGVFRAVSNTLKKHGIEASEIDFISAHGTATPYNDEMEAQAFNRLSLEEKPLNSLKGYFGHTLGGAGLVESIITLHSLKNNKLIATKGFQNLGTTLPLNVLTETVEQPVTLALKTASGFGGCNAAILLKQE